MRLEIITIGDELLIGQTVDTNSAWMGKVCNENGLIVNRITSISDNEEEIVAALNEAFARVDLVFMTGGLGPTKDDITKKVLARYFNTELERNPVYLKQIEQFFSERNRPILEVNRQQADLPKDALILENKLGTAPGMWFTMGDKSCISMPGVPYEMQGIISNEVLPRLQQSKSKVYHKHIVTSGIGESFLAEIIKDWEEEIRGKGYGLAYLPTPGIVKIRISSYNATEESIKDIDRLAQVLPTLIPDNFIGFDVSSLPEALLYLALEKNVSLSFAESCTGGALAASFVKQTGASKVLKGSVVAYTEEVKKSQLKVNTETLKKHTVVSEEVASEMAMGVKTLMNTDFSVSTTGVAGPDGGTKEKPVGLVCFSVATPVGITSKNRVFRGDRDLVIKQATNYAFNYLIKSMQEYFNNQKKSC